MKEKPDVLQGTLALMVLKTLDVLGPQHGWGIARRIEQSAETCWQSTKARSIPCCSGWKSTQRLDCLRVGRIGRITAERAFIGLPGPAASNSRPDPGVGASSGDYRSIFRSESGGSDVKFLRRSLIRLSNLATGGVPTNACRKRSPNISRSRQKRTCAPGCRRPRRGGRPHSSSARPRICEHHHAEHSIPFLSRICSST